MLALQSRRPQPAPPAQATITPRLTLTSEPSIVPSTSRLGEVDPSDTKGVLTAPTRPIPRPRTTTSGTTGPVLDYATAADLRRKRSRDLSSRLVRLAQWLEPDDRAIAQATFRDNLTARDVAQVRGTSPRLIRRRLRLLIKRLTTPLFEFVARERENWPAPRRHIATSVVLHGKSHREAAQHLRTSLHTVRTEMNIVQALAQE